MYAADGRAGPAAGAGGGALGEAAFGSVAEALRAGGAFADFLNSPAAASPARIEDPARFSSREVLERASIRPSCASPNGTSISSEPTT